MAVLKLIKFMFKEHKAFPIYVVLISSATILSSVGLFGYSSYLIAFCALHPDISLILTTVVLIRFFGVARAAIRYAERYVSHNVTFKMLKSIRTWVYQRVSKMEYADVIVLDKERVLTHLMDDVESLQDFYLRTFNPFVTSVVVGLLGVVILSFFSGLIAMIFILFYIICIIVIPIMLWAFGRGINQECEACAAQAKIKLLDFFRHYIEICVNNSSKRSRKEIEDTQERSYQLEYKLALLKSLSTQLNLLIANMAMLFCIVVGARLVAIGELKGVLLPMLVLMVFSLFEGTLPVGELFHKLEIAGHSSKNITHLEDVSIMEEQREGTLEVKIHKISIENLTYFYPNTEKVAIEDITFSIKKGEKIAIVGHSGSGKSTLAQVLLGWLKGNTPLSFNDVSIEKYSQHCVENAIMLVAQKSYFFHTSIRNNMKIANENATDEEIITAIRDVGLERWYSNLKERLESSVGENAMMLSGGERQRFALARAILSKRDFIILDEMTAGLDVYMESKILDLVFQLFRECGLITITHRLTYMNHYNKIYVMNRGKIVECGTHQELLSKNGEYATLYRLQSQIV